MKVCMIGVRGHNGYVLEGMTGSEGNQIVGIAPSVPGDDLSELTEGCAKAGHSPREFGDHLKMLDQMEPDLATIAGPFNRHAEIAAEVFGRGIHLFCEKPVATTLEDLDRLRGAHEKAGVHFAAMMGIRYDPHFYTAWRAVQDGAVGTVRLMDTRKSYKLGQRGDEYKKRETYGGTIPWVGSHSIDWMPWFSGERFVSVFAAHSSAYNRDHGEFEVSALCEFTMTDEVFASASIDYLRPENAPTHGDDRMRIAGTDGVIEVRGGEVFLINASTDGEEKLETSCDRQIFADFVAQCRGQGECLVTAEQTFDVTEACLRARQSADEKRLVYFDE